MTSNILIVKVDLLIYAIILNLIMMVYIHSQQEKRVFSVKLLFWVLGFISLVTAAEAVTWFSSEIGIYPSIPIRYWSNVIHIGLAPVPACLGLIYLDYKIFGDQQASKRRGLFYMVPTYFGVLAMVYNYYVPGSVFLVDASNQYQRGALLYIIAGLLYTYMLLVSIRFFSHKRLMTKRVMRAVGLYFLVPTAGLCLQLLTYGTTFTMPSHTLAIFIIVLLVEKDELSKDSLTSLYTRTNFVNRLERKVKTSEPFNMILIDVDDFKDINDNHGHLEGDKVLQTIASILLEATTVEDLVCRYGGDEFFLLVERKYEASQEVVNKIETALDAYNEKNKAYRISLSFGQLFVDKRNTESVDALISEIDKRMYEDKLRRKEQYKQ